jgi:hypothetical protein
MQREELIDALKEHIKRLDGERIEKIDFDQMQEDLKASTEALLSLQKKEELCDQLLGDFKSEIKRMSLAVSRAQGDLNPSGMVERLLSSDNLSFDELVLLRQKIREDFNRSFPTKPRARVIHNFGSGGFKASEFKAGVRE